MSRNRYISGQWNLICDICGKKIKAGEARHRWDGFMVCERDFEYRHPQDFVRARQDKISVPFTRPRPVDIYIHVCTPYTTQGRADMGVADCARADYVVEPSEYCTMVGSTGVIGYSVVGCARVSKNL